MFTTCESAQSALLKSIPFRRYTQWLNLMRIMRFTNKAKGIINGKLVTRKVVKMLQCRNLNGPNKFIIST